MGAQIGGKVLIACRDRVTTNTSDSARALGLNLE